MSERELYVEAWNKVNGFFNNADKTRLWFKTRNPLLGNVSPAFMMYTGRIKKLIKFIDACLEGNFS